MDSNTIHTAITTAFQYFQNGDSGRTEFMLGHLLMQNPNNVMVLTALADLNYQTLRMIDAVAYTEKAHSHLSNPTLDEALYVSKMLRCIGEDELAMALPRQFVGLSEIAPEHTAMLAIHFLNLDLINESLIQFEKADDKVLGDYGIAMHGIAKLYSGDIKAALERFLAALAINPGNAIAALQCALINEPEGRENRIAEWVKLCKTPLLPADSSQLQFALFHEYDAIGDTNNAFKSLETANAIRLTNQPYNAALETELVDDYLLQLADIDFSQDYVSNENASIPVFIIGLPRTGTTLLEKTLTSLADIQAVGEHLNFRKSIERQLGLVFTSPFEIANRQFSKKFDFAKLGSRYHEKTLWRACGQPYYTDKEPFNFAYAGLIAKAMPNAKIIHIRRNPMDSCFSAFKQSFAIGGFPASYSLESLAQYYRNYDRVMAFWRNTLGSRMLEIRYEDLVLRHAETKQKIKAYCQFNHIDAASEVKSYKASTLSAAQVQKPIHAGNINAWAKYSEYLQPLRTALDKEYTEYMSGIEGVEIL